MGITLPTTTRSIGPADTGAVGRPTFHLIQCWPPKPAISVVSGEVFVKLPSGSGH
jgi:hypothetical protein